MARPLTHFPCLPLTLRQDTPHCAGLGSGPPPDLTPFPSSPTHSAKTRRIALALAQALPPHLAEILQAVAPVTAAGPSLLSPDDNDSGNGGSIRPGQGADDSMRRALLDQSQPEASSPGAPQQQLPPKHPRNHGPIQRPSPLPTPAQAKVAVLRYLNTTLDYVSGDINVKVDGPLPGTQLGGGGGGSFTGDKMAAWSGWHSNATGTSAGVVW